MKAYVLLVAVIGAVSACQFPPHLWCSSPDIALQCKVYKQCQRTVWTPKPNAPPVNLELYYESLCPFCQMLIVHQITPTFKAVGDIMNLTLVPYGNAAEKFVGGKWQFTCQHGEQECIGNMLETCAIHTLETVPKFLPLISCVEASQGKPMTSFQKCARELSIPLDPIMSCFNSSLGNQLEHQMALKTGALKPPHNYVPWVVLNGVHTEKINNEAYSNLLKLICDTYTGPKPAACTQLEEENPSVCLRSN